VHWAGTVVSSTSVLGLHKIQALVQRQRGRRRWRSKAQTCHRRVGIVDKDHLAEVRLAGRSILRWHSVQGRPSDQSRMGSDCLGQVHGMAQRSLVGGSGRKRLVGSFEVRFANRTASKASSWSSAESLVLPPLLPASSCNRSTVQGMDSSALIR
jgi:hypothetical protein